MSQTLLIAYRLVAALVISMPLIINLTIKGDIVSSFIYAPIFTILALVLAVYLDDKIEHSLQQTKLRLTVIKAAKTTSAKVKTPLLARFRTEYCCFK
ncbi:hypothetical protein AAEU29_10600 [Pseudoalteromonas sp. SSM20]|uniref:hypothetical protein n=1 Tax=Pseudoalteromonas sp. SSM20 TaxID=3139394 RepID=UPI003BA9194C